MNGSREVTSSFPRERAQSFVGEVAPFELWGVPYRQPVTQQAGLVILAIINCATAFMLAPLTRTVPRGLVGPTAGDDPGDLRARPRATLATSLSATSSVLLTMGQCMWNGWFWPAAALTTPLPVSLVGITAGLDLYREPTVGVEGAGGQLRRRSALDSADPLHLVGLRATADGGHRAAGYCEMCRG